jgi:hypothetical protein
MKTVKDENSNLRAKIRRLEEDNARKRKEIDALCDTSKVTIIVNLILYNKIFLGWRFTTNIIWSINRSKQ